MAITKEALGEYILRELHGVRDWAEIDMDIPGGRLSYEPHADEVLYYMENVNGSPRETLVIGVAFDEPTATGNDGDIHLDIPEIPE
jgi:hypothetical protein